MQNNNFNPEKNPERIIEYFDTGPSILALFRCSIEKEYSEIHCIDRTGKEVAFFIPRHTIGAQRCNVSNSLYILVKVSKSPDTEPIFWLMTCVYSRRGYLFPIDAFNEEGEYVPLEAVT